MSPFEPWPKRWMSRFGPVPERSTSRLGAEAPGRPSSPGTSRRAGTSRREALRTAALGAGALAAAGLLRPALAGAQTESEQQLRDFLVEAIALEEIAVLAYATAARQLGGRVEEQLNLLRDQEQAHANAWRAALDSLGFDPPDPPDSPEDTGVYDDVEGLDDEAVDELKATLGDLGGVSKEGDFFNYLTDLEQQQIDYYLEFAPPLDSEDLRTTTAEVVANQSQHLVVLATEQGEDPVPLLAGDGRGG